MHYHCEILVPPGTDIRQAVVAAMEPFNENQEKHEDDDTDNPCAFWDWYIIGGRWAGDKLIAGLDKDKIDQFYRWLQEEGVTVSALTAGKQEIQPASQIPKVDAKWNELFPSDTPTACPLFSHANNQYDSTSLISGDIMRLGDVPASLTCERVIILGPAWSRSEDDWTGPLKPVFMLSKTWWNGLNHQDANWDGTLKQAVDIYTKQLEHYADRYRDTYLTDPDWLSVTVDYHS